MKSPSQHIESKVTLQGREGRTGYDYFTLPRMIICDAYVVAVGTYHEQHL